MAHKFLAISATNILHLKGMGLQKLRTHKRKKMDSSVFHKDTFSNKKNCSYPHCPIGQQEQILCKIPTVADGILSYVLFKHIIHLSQLDTYVQLYSTYC